MKTVHALVAIWRMVEFADLDKDGEWQYRFGEHPRGYFARLNSRSLLETRTSLRATACAAISVSNGPMGVPARSSFARTRAYEAASFDVNSTTSRGRRKFSTSRKVFAAEVLLAAPVSSSASVMTVTAMSSRL